MHSCFIRATALCAALLVLPAAAVQADVITFGVDNNIDRLDQAGPQIEGSFSYAATVGEGWEVQSSFGNPPSALVTFFNGEGALAGDRVEITRVGGGTFQFNSIDYRTILDEGNGNDTVRVSGLLAGNIVDSFPITDGRLDFLTVASPFDDAIDTLRIEVSFDGNNAMIFDNVTLTIPEPASAGLLGAAGLLALRRRRVA